MTRDIEFFHFCFKTTHIIKGPRGQNSSSLASPMKVCVMGPAHLPCLTPDQPHWPVLPAPGKSVICANLFLLKTGATASPPSQLLQLGSMSCTDKRAMDNTNSQ